MKALFALAVMLASQNFVAPAYAQGPNLNTYYNWCDNVELILNNSTRIANALYAQTKFAQAKQVMVNGFQQALNSANLPGSFRPNTYRELVRTLELIRTLEATTATASQTLKDKAIAYVALNRVSVVTHVKRALDRPYVIPCYGQRCAGGYQTQYGTPAVNMGQFEAALAGVARMQLSVAQKYASTVIPGRRIQVYPLVDTATYFTIISKAAQWAAEDLSMTLFGNTFACAIMELQNLGAEASSLAAMVGEVAAVQYIHMKVEVLKSAMNVAPYGCGGIQYPSYPGYGYDNYNQQSDISGDEY